MYRGWWERTYYYLKKKNLEKITQNLESTSDQIRRWGVAADSSGVLTRRAHGVFDLFSFSSSKFARGADHLDGLLLIQPDSTLSTAGTQD